MKVKAFVQQVPIVSTGTGNGRYEVTISGTGTKQEVDKFMDLVFPDNAPQKTKVPKPLPTTKVKSSAGATDKHICADYPNVQCCFQGFAEKPKCTREDKQCSHIRLLT